MNSLLKCIIISVFIILNSCQKHSQVLCDNSTGSDSFIRSQEQAIDYLLEFMDDVGYSNTKSGKYRDILSIDTYPPLTKSNDDIEAYIVNFQDYSGYAVLGARGDMAPIVAVTEQGSIDPVTLFVIDRPVFGDDQPLDSITFGGPVLYDGDENGVETIVDEWSMDNLYSESEADYYVGGDFSLFIAETIESGLNYRESASMPSEDMIDYDESSGTGGGNSGSGGNAAPILPKLLTAWDQDSPYNDFCKQVNSYRRLAGCSSVAAGMIMAYNHFPDTLIVNGTQINWSAIDWIYNLYNSSPEPQRTQIPLLLASVFWKCDRLAYREDWTMITANQIKKRFKKMDYKNVTMLMGSEFTDAMWSETLQMLTADKPVYISAVGRRVKADGSEKIAGHSWVIDGAGSDRSMLHCNWGWSGNSNGYFSKDCFKVSSSTYDRHFRLIRYDISGHPKVTVNF